MSRSTISCLDVIISLAVSSPKRMIPCRMLSSPFSSCLSVISRACSSSSMLKTRPSFCITFSAIIPVDIRMLSNGQNSLLETRTRVQTLLQKASGFCLLYTFGSISPNSRSRKVSRTVMHRNSSHTAFPKLMVCEKI